MLYSFFSDLLLNICALIALVNAKDDLRFRWAHTVCFRLGLFLSCLDVCDR